MLEGQGVSWLKLGRIRKLMEDENYRNFIVSRLNRNLDKKLSDDTPHLEDVVIVLAKFSKRFFGESKQAKTKGFYCTWFEI